MNGWRATLATEHQSPVLNSPVNKFATIACMRPFGHNSYDGFAKGVPIMHAAKFFDARRGATAIQYGLIAALVSIGMAAALPQLGGKLSTTMCSAAAGMGGNGCGPDAQTLAATTTFNTNYGATRGHISVTAAGGFMLTYDGTNTTGYSYMCGDDVGVLNSSAPKTCTISAAASLASLVSISGGNGSTNNCSTGAVLWSGIGSGACISGQVKTTCTNLGGTYLGTIGSSTNMCQFP